MTGLVACFLIGFNLPGFHLLYKYNSPIIIFSAICFFLFFRKIDIGYKKWINYIAKSTLAVVCIHAPYPFRDLMIQGFGTLEKYHSTHYAAFNMEWLFGNPLMMNIIHVMIWLIAVIAIYMFGVLLDQVRIESYKLLEKYIKD